MNAGTESLTLGASIGPPPVTLYDIITPRWLLQYVYIENMLGMKLSYMFELRSEICYASTSLPCASFELLQKCRLLVSSEIYKVL